MLGLWMPSVHRQAVPPGACGGFQDTQAFPFSALIYTSDQTRRLPGYQRLGVFPGCAQLLLPVKTLSLGDQSSS